MAEFNTVTGGGARAVPLRQSRSDHDFRLQFDVLGDFPVLLGPAKCAVPSCSHSRRLRRD